MAGATARVAVLVLVVLCLTSQACAVRVSSAINGMPARRNDDEPVEPKLNTRPIVGVVAQAGTPAPPGHTYIAGSYIKFIQSAGARVIPILPDMPPDEVARRFNAVNGILVPGGSQDLRPGRPFYDTVAQLFDLTVAANDAGDFFPLHGTCLGFEALAVIASKNHSILSDFDAQDLASPLFPTDLAEDSVFFSSLPKKVYNNLMKKPYAMENHVKGVAWTALEENPSLSSFFDVLTLSVDRGGRTYISTMEAKDYPISGTQWHPEKNAFEWTLTKNIPHEAEAIVVTQEVANFFISETRKNFHAAQNMAQESSMMIYNYAPTFTGKMEYAGQEVDFDETYFFPPWSEIAPREEAAARDHADRRRTPVAAQ